MCQNWCNLNWTEMKHVLYNLACLLWAPNSTVYSFRKQSCCKQHLGTPVTTSNSFRQQSCCEQHELGFSHHRSSRIKKNWQTANLILGNWVIPGSANNDTAEKKLTHSNCKCLVCSNLFRLAGMNRFQFLQCGCIFALSGHYSKLLALAPHWSKAYKSDNFVLVATLQL